MPFHKVLDLERYCQYIGVDLGYEYFISNEGNFASHDGASYEAHFLPVNYKGFKAFVENEAPDSGEVFVWVGLEDYLTGKDGQYFITLKSMIKLVKENPLLDFLYVYDLAAGATDFYTDDQGLHFTDALGNEVLLKEEDDYEFYVDGLSIQVAPTNKVIMYKPDFVEDSTED